MPEQLPSNHPSVQMFHANIARSGDTRRPRLRVLDDVTAADDNFVRLHLDGIAYRARPSADASRFVIRGAYDSKRLTHAPNGGESRLVEWCRGHDRTDDDAVELGELNDGYQYGLRVPGVR